MLFTICGFQTCTTSLSYIICLFAIICLIAVLAYMYYQPTQSLTDGMLLVCTVMGYVKQVSQHFLTVKGSFSLIIYQHPLQQFKVFKHVMQ